MMVIRVQQIIGKMGFNGALQFLKISKKDFFNFTALISHIGVPVMLSLMTSEYFPDDLKEVLSKKHLFINGYPNVSLISSLES